MKIFIWQYSCCNRAAVMSRQLLCKDDWSDRDRHIFHKTAVSYQDYDKSSHLLYDNEKIYLLGYDSFWQGLNNCDNISLSILGIYHLMCT